jgi:amino acid adenylation domain-containing protein
MTLPDRRPGPVPLSYAQQRLWFLHQLNGASPEYHIPEVFRLRGRLDLAALRRAAETIVARHESLRTGFRMVGDEPRQFVNPPGPVRILVNDLRPTPASVHSRHLAEALSEEWRQSFDLVRGPLLRLRLLRFADEDFVLLLTVHHIASDGWSQGVLRAELATLYRAFLDGAPDPLPPLPIQYGDFARWQRDRIEDGAAEGNVAYWTEQLAGLPDRLELPTDRPRHATKAARGSVCRTTVDDEILDRLRELSRRNRSTLYMTMLAAYAVLLARYSRQDDLAVGSPVTHRTSVDLEGAIGFFVNTLVLRVHVTPELGFDKLLGEVRQTALQAYRHQDVPFERLVEELAPQRRLDRTPLFQATFSLQTMPERLLDLAGLDVSPVDLPEVLTRFDLELHGWERPAELTLIWVYDENLFDRESMEQMLRHYTRVLEQVAADPTTNIGNLLPLDEDERDWLTGQHAADVPALDTAHAMFADEVGRDPDAIAVRHRRNEITYAELDRLAAEHTPAPGTRVLIDMPDGDTPAGVDLLAEVLGALRSGATFVAVPPDEPAGRRALMEQDGGTVPAEHPNATACVVYVSSPTGGVDGVACSHAALTQRLVWMRDQFDLMPGDRVLRTTPAGSATSILEVLLPLVTGATLVMASIGDSDDLVDVIRRERISVVHLTPTALRGLVGVPGLRSCASLRCVITGGEVLPADLSGRFAAALPGAKLWNTYGATETTGSCAYYHCSGDPGHDMMPIGRPTSGTRLLVLDDSMALVPRGVVGELYVGGTGVAEGYVDRPKQTTGRFVADPFHPGGRLWRSGDLVRWRTDGGLEYVGRTDRQLKPGGRRVEPAEIEAALRRRPGVRRAKVAGADAYVEPKLDVDLDELRILLPAHMVPARIIPVDDLNAPMPAVAPPRAARTPQEEMLCPLFAEVLGRDEVDVSDNFFAMGGHSLLAMRLIAKIYEVVGVELSVRDIFEAPTPADLAVLVR